VYCQRSADIVRGWSSRADRNDTVLARAVSRLVGTSYQDKFGKLSCPAHWEHDSSSTAFSL
jgi:hypothetical protein